MVSCCFLFTGFHNGKIPDSSKLIRWVQPFLNSEFYLYLDWWKNLDWSRFCVCKSNFRAFILGEMMADYHSETNISPFPENLTYYLVIAIAERKHIISWNQNSIGSWRLVTWVLLNFPAFFLFFLTIFSKSELDEPLERGYVRGLQSFPAFFLPSFFLFIKI